VSDAIEVMNETHVEIGERAAELAMQVLESINPADIPVATAVSLLKFGVELQRKALLGAEADGGDADPFEALTKALSGQPPEKEED
jgi:hypothetical protein